MLSSPPLQPLIILEMFQGNLLWGLMCYIFIFWDLISEKFPFPSRKKLLLDMEVNFDDSLMNVYAKIMDTDISQPSSQLFHIFLRPYGLFNFLSVDEVRGVWRKLHNEELHNLYSSPSMIRMIKSRSMGLAGHV
jgi:hypothetical protein